MVKLAIISLLTEKHQHFMEQFVAMDENEFITSANGKWNSSQQLDHIIRAVQPVVLALSLPSFLLKFIFGNANRPSKSYESLVGKYKSKLATGGRATGRFVPKGFSFAKKIMATKKLEKLILNLTTSVATKSEKELDNLILPHPLLGKLTLREMLYFTAYHAEHHTQGLRTNLNLDV